MACLSLDDMFPALGVLGQWSPLVDIGGLSGSHMDKCLIYEQQVTIITYIGNVFGIIYINMLHAYKQLLMVYNQ